MLASSILLINITLLGMKTLVVRNRNSGYSTTITPLAEDSQYWYVIEERGKKDLDTLRYAKTDFDFMGEK